MVERQVVDDDHIPNGPGIVAQSIRYRLSLLVEIVWVAAICLVDSRFKGIAERGGEILAIYPLLSQVALWETLEARFESLDGTLFLEPRTRC